MFAKRNNREQETCRDVAFLNQVKHAVESLGLAVRCKVEPIADNVRNTSFLCVTASEMKECNEHFGPFHQMKLLFSPKGVYELRSNTHDLVEKGSSDLENTACLHKIVSKISKDTPFRVCPGLRNPRFLKKIKEQIMLRIKIDVKQLSWVQTHV